VPPKQKPPKGLILAVVGLLLLSIIFIVLTVMFYSQMSNYKNNSDEISAKAVLQANDELKKKLDLEYSEKDKLPNKEYTTPSSAASVKIVYPKTWDLYFIEDNNRGTVDNYFNFNMVPDISNKDNQYSLRLEVLDKNYTEVAKSYDTDAKKGAIIISPYKPELVPNAQTGILITGDIRKDVKGQAVILPVRDKTIKIWTEGANYINDFNNVVLKNLTYNP
jgi:hypothetical protein